MPPCPSPTPRACSDSFPLSLWCHSTISPSVILLSLVLNLSQHQDLFKWVGSLYQVARVLELQLQLQSFHEYSWLISFRIYWFDLHADKVSQESFPTPQFKSINSFVLSFLSTKLSAVVQILHPYMTIGKTIALTEGTFVGKLMSLLFNMLSKLVTAFLPRSKNLLISWLQPPSAMILEPKKIKCHSFHCFPIYLPWSEGTRCHDISFLNVELQASFNTHSPK